MNSTRNSRHGKPCTVKHPQEGYTFMYSTPVGFTAETIRRGVTARQLVNSGRAATVRQARKLLRVGDRQAAAA